MSSKILIVDDSATIRMQLRACLSPAGFEIVEADNGANGLQRAKSEPFDLIIVDVNMPIMSGLEMLEAARQSQELKNIPAFVLTTERSKDMVARGKKAGATAWIVKPFNPDILRKGVEAVLAKAKEKTLAKAA